MKLEKNFKNTVMNHNGRTMDNKLILDGFTIELVKVKGNAAWATKALLNDKPNEPRYQSYYYKKETSKGMQE